MTLDIGPVLALVLVQLINLGVTALAAWNARTASQRAAAALEDHHAQTSRTSDVGPIDPTLHKE